MEKAQYTPTNYLYLYSKDEDQKSYYPCDLAGNRQVAPLMYASRIHPDRYQKLRLAVEKEHEGNPKTHYYIKETGTNKILFRTDADSN